MDVALEVIDTAKDVSERKVALETLISLVTAAVTERKEAIGPQCRHIARTFTAVMGEHDLATMQSQANGDDSLGVSMFPEVAEALGLIMVSPADRWLHRAIAGKVIPTLAEGMPKLIPLEEKEQRVSTVLAILFFGLCQGESNVAPVTEFFNTLDSAHVAALKSLLTQPGKFPGLPPKLSEQMAAHHAAGKGDLMCSDEVKICWEGLREVLQQESTTAAVATWVWNLNTLVGPTTVKSGSGDEEVEVTKEDKYALLKQFKRLCRPSQEAVFTASVGLSLVEEIAGTHRSGGADGSLPPSTPVAPMVRLAQLKETVTLLEKEFKVRNPMQEYKSLRGVIVNAFVDQTSSFAVGDPRDTEEVMELLLVAIGTDKRQAEYLTKLLPGAVRVLSTDERSDKMNKLAAQLAERIPFNAVQNLTNPVEQVPTALDIIRTAVNDLVDSPLSAAVVDGDERKSDKDTYISQVEPALHVLHMILQLKLSDVAEETLLPAVKTNKPASIGVAESVDVNADDDQKPSAAIPSTSKISSAVGSNIDALLSVEQADKLRKVLEAINSVVGAEVLRKRASLKTLSDFIHDSKRKNDRGGGGERSRRKPYASSHQHPKNPPFSVDDDDEPRTPSHGPDDEPTTPPGTPPLDDLPLPAVAASEEEKKDPTPNETVAAELNLDERAAEVQMSEVKQEQPTQSREDMEKESKAIRTALHPAETVERLCNSILGTIGFTGDKGKGAGPPPSIRTIAFSWRGGSNSTTGGGNGGGGSNHHRTGNSGEMRRVGGKDIRTFSDNQRRDAPNQRRQQSSSSSSRGSGYGGHNNYSRNGGGASNYNRSQSNSGRRR